MCIPCSLQELREWLPFAEAPYYEFSSEVAIETWLRKRGYALVYAQRTATLNQPAHCVAVNSKKKQLVICVRGTETPTDALTDCVGALLAHRCNRACCCQR